jgi:diguanylate cyclase (GGDEF)-like protein
MVSPGAKRSSNSTRPRRTGVRLHIGARVAALSGPLLDSDSIIFPARRHLFVHSQTNPAPPDAARLQLADAMLLLQQSGRELPDRRAVAPVVWMQAMIDGLCELSSRDPLTGLSNRRQFELALASEIDRVARAGEPALVLMIDIDHFKQVNDTHGHPAGDLVLKGVAQALHDCIRPMDTLARFGGEEFAMILPNCPPTFGLAVAERVRTKVQQRAVAIAPGQQAQVTISIGGAFAPQWVRSSAALWISRADQQLYRAKAEGRNRACLEQPTVSLVSAEEKGLLFGTSKFAELE